MKKTHKQRKPSYKIKTRKNISRKTKKGGFLMIPSLGIRAKLTGVSDEQRKKIHDEYIQLQEEYKRRKEFAKDPEKMQKFDENIKTLYENGKIPIAMKNINPDKNIYISQINAACDYLSDNKKNKTEKEIIKLRCKKGWSKSFFENILQNAIENQRFSPDFFTKLSDNEKSLVCNYMLDEKGLFYSNQPIIREQFVNSCITNSLSPLQKSSVENNSFEDTIE